MESQPQNPDFRNKTDKLTTFTHTDLYSKALGQRGSRR